MVGDGILKTRRGESGKAYPNLEGVFDANRPAIDVVKIRADNLAAGNQLEILAGENRHLGPQADEPVGDAAGIGADDVVIGHQATEPLEAHRTHMGNDVGHGSRDLVARMVARADETDRARALQEYVRAIRE